MAACIFNSLKRFPFSLNSVRLQSICFSHTIFAVAGEPKSLPATHFEVNRNHLQNRELLLQSAAGYKKTTGNIKLPENVVYYSHQNTSSSSDDGTSNPKQCSNEQLAIVFENLRVNLPQLFVTVMDYSIYHPQLIFENNIQGKRTVGLPKFMYKIAMLKLFGHYKYAFVNFEILKMTKHPEDSTVKIRWRISGITGFQLALQMWKYKVWKPTEMLQEKKVWIDGFSTMYVGSDGKIFKHVADRMMPDQNTEAIEKEKILSRLGGVPKVALFIGLSPDISIAFMV